MGVEDYKVKQFLDMAGVIFIVLDEHGTVIFANRMACEIFECTQSHLFNKNWLDVCLKYKSSEAVHNETVSLENVMKGDIKQEESFVCPIQPPRGKVRILHWHTALLRNENNQISGVVLTGNDVTERMRAARALKESEQRYRDLLQTANDAIFTVDNNGKIRSWNFQAEKIYGYCAGEIIDKPFLLLAPRRFHADQLKVLDRVFLMGSLSLPQRIIEAPSRRKDGSEFPVEFSVSLWEAGENYNLTVIVRDITERKQAEERLMNSETNLRMQARKLQDMNTSLRVLLSQGEEYKKEFEEKLLFNVKELISPYLKKLRQSNLDPKQRDCVANLESNVLDIVSSFKHGEPSRYLDLTPSEIRVANLVKEGKRTKEIAEIVNLSFRTVEFHRNNIRKKFGIRNKKSNLRSYLLSV